MQPTDKTITVAVVESLDEWARISDEWDILWEKEPQASVFNTARFLQTFWAHFMKDTGRLFVLLMRDGSQQLIGAAPFIIRRRKMSGFPVRVLSLMTHPMLIDRPQFLLPTRRSEQLSTLFSFLLKCRSRWDVFELNEQVLDADYLESLSKYFDHAARFRKDIFEFSFQPYLTIYPKITTWPDYLQTRSKKHRKKWRYIQNRINREGKLSVTRHSNLKEFPPVIREYAQIESKSWKDASHAKLNDKHYEFLLDLWAKMQPQGNLHFVFLRLDNRPMAGLIGLSFGSRYAAMQSSYDKAFHNFSPGFLIGGYDINWAIEHRVAEYDFMSGYLSDKLLWTDTFRRTYVVRTIQKSVWSGVFCLTKFVVNPTIVKLASILGIEEFLLKTEKARMTAIKKSKFKKHNFRLRDSEVD